MNRFYLSYEDNVCFFRKYGGNTCLNFKGLLIEQVSPYFFWGRKKSWEKFLDVINIPISDPKIPWILKIFTFWSSCGFSKVFYYATMIDKHYPNLFKYVLSVFSLYKSKKPKIKPFFKPFKTLKQTYYRFSPLTIFEKTWVFDFSCIISRLVRCMTSKLLAINRQDVFTSENIF